MRKRARLLAPVLLSLLAVSCVKVEKAQNAAQTDSLTATRQIRNKLVSDIANTNSDVYKNPSEKIELLRKMATEKPEKYRAVIDKLNMLRALRGKKPIKPSDLVNGSYNATKKLSIATVAPDTEAANLVACMSARVPPPPEPGGGGAEPPSWEPGQDCPDNCVCASAFAAAEAWADVYAFGEGFAWANASATCASGEVVTVSAEAWALAYAEAHAYAYAIAYAYAFACAPEPADVPGCEPQPPACQNVGDGPVTKIPVQPMVSNTPIPTVPASP